MFDSNIITVKWIYFVIIIGIIGNVVGDKPKMGGPADMLIKNMQLCPDPQIYRYEINVKRHKVNRTHEALDGFFNLGAALDDKIGIYITIAKKDDGTDVYKPNAYEFKDDNACFFLVKWVGKGFLDILEMINQPRMCPLIAGYYTVKNFLIDSRTLPQTLPYGDFRGELFLIEEEERVSCLRVFFTIKPKEFLG